jgi:predicted Zn-dependent protease
MGRIRSGIRLLLRRSPRWLLVLLALGAIGTGYFVVRCVQFEYHFRASLREYDREAFEEAGERLARCLEIDPRSGRAHFLAARTARRSGQPDFAEEELTACEDLDWPADAVQLERTLLLAQRGEFDGADKAALDRALAEDDPDRFLVLEALAQGNMRLYSLNQALECLDRWVKGQPDSPGARMRRGWVLERLERIPEAEQDYRHLLGVRPDHRPAKLRLAQLLLQQSQPSEAARLFEELDAASDGDPAVGLGLARCYVGLGRRDEARTLLDGLLEREPDHPTALLERGKLALTDRRLEEARGWLVRAAAKSPQAYEPHYQLFLCLQALGESSEAGSEEQRFKAIEADLRRMSDLTLALQRRPSDPALRFEVAEIFLRRGEESEGITWLESVVRIAPSHAKARRLLVDLYERTGNPRQARTHRQALAKADRERPR